MANTDSIMEQDSAASDFEVFVGPFAFFKVAGPSAIGGYNPGPPPSVQFNAFGLTGVMADVTGAIKRTGMGISPKSTQPGYPPMKGSQMTTVAGPITTPPQKGIMINSVDIAFYLQNPITGSASLITLTATRFVDNAAPVVTTLLSNVPWFVNLPLGSWKKNYPISTPGFIITPDTQVLLYLSIDTNQGGGSLTYLFGVVLHCSYNFN